MPVTNEWYIENKVLHTRMIGDVTLQDLIDSSAVGTAMISNGDAFVFSVVDASQLTSFPRNIKDLRQLSSLPNSPKLRWIVIYGIPNPIVSFMATTFAHFMNTSYKVVKTREEAFAMAEEFARLGDTGV